MAVVCGPAPTAGRARPFSSHCRSANLAFDTEGRGHFHIERSSPRALDASAQISAFGKLKLPICARSRAREGSRVVGRNRFIAPLGCSGTKGTGRGGADWRNKAIAPYKGVGLRSPHGSGAKIPAVYCSQIVFSMPPALE